MDEQLEFFLSSCALINRLPQRQMISNDEQTVSRQMEMDEQLEFFLSSCALINRLPRSQMISNDEQTDSRQKSLRRTVKNL